MRAVHMQAYLHSLGPEHRHTVLDVAARRCEGVHTACQEVT